MTLKQKITGFLIIALTLFSLATIPIQAQLKRQNSIDAMSKKQGLNVDKYSLNSLHGDIASAGELIFPSGTSDGESLTYGAVPMLAQGVANLAVLPPIQTGEYVADVLNNIGIAQPAYAQGIGFAGLSPVLSIWKAFRNLSYFLFIIIFVVVGFMIMFRAQINPQTVVTVQTALPKLILTLILITFSYAIAGFVVDLIYLSTFVIFSMLEAFNILQSASTARDAIFGLSIFRIGIKYFWAPGEVAGASAQAVSAIAQGLVGMPNFFLFDWIVDAVMYLIIAVAILVQLFRTFFALLLAYVGIIFAVIFAPLQLLLNALPGSDTFSNWLKGLVANAAVFPTIGVMVIIGAYLVGGNSVADLGVEASPRFGVNSSSGFIPPMITTRDPTEEFGVNQIRGIIGLGILMLLPEAAKIVKGALQVKDSEYGQVAYQNASFLSRTVGNAGGLVVSGTLQHYAPGMIFNAREGLGRGISGVKNRMRRARGLPDTAQDDTAAPIEDRPEPTAEPGSRD